MNSCNTSDEDSCNTCYASCLSRVIRRTVNDQVAALEQSILARTTGTDLEGKKKVVLIFFILFGRAQDI